MRVFRQKMFETHQRIAHISVPLVCVHTMTGLAGNARKLGLTISCAKEKMVEESWHAGATSVGGRRFGGGSDPQY